MNEENPYKTNKEWKILINKKLNYDEFQHLCREILKANSFINVKPRGEGGDGKRDIEAELDTFIGKERIVKKCWAQCKNHNDKTALNYKSFSTDVIKAQNNRIEEFLIMSNKDLSPNGKTDIQEWNKEKNICKIRDWTGNIFLDYLFSSPSICARFFPDEQVPHLIAKENPKKAIKIMVKFGEQIGIELDFKVEEGFDEKNPYEVGKFLKKNLLNLSCDDSQKVLIYQKSSFVFFALGMKEETMFFLDKTLDIDNENKETLLIKGYILEKLDEIEESNKVYDELLQINANSMEALNNKGFNLYRQGNFDEAMKLIGNCLKIKKDYIPAIKNKINILLDKRLFDEALNFLDKNSFAFEKSIDLMSKKVHLLIGKLDLKQAFRINEEILKREPNNISAINNKGVIFERNSKYQKKDKYSKLALYIFDEVIKKDNNFPLGWSNKVIMLINNSKLDKAEETIENAYSMFPDSPEVRNAKGEVFLLKKEPKKAMRYFNSALKKSYKAKFLLNRASAKLQVRHFDKALKDTEKILKNDSKNSKAWWIKGICLKKLRRPLFNEALRNSEKFKEKPISLLEDENEKK
jgi:tetratricopeptide (TPR) repeat protein